MSSRDERVVEMRFDNAQFEKGVSQTLNTLDRLKEGLKFENAISGLGLIQNAINGVKLGGIENGVDKINNKFSALGVAGMEVVKRITNSALDAVTKVATAIPNQIKQGGWSRALNIENARFQLEGLKVAWDDVSKDLSYAVNGTAYGLDAAAKAAAQLSASGIQASSDINLTAKNVDEMADSLLGVSSAEARANGDLDDMSIALRSISGVAAMTNSSYDDIANVFIRVAGQGRVMATDLNSLAARGLNAAATLGDALGVSEAEVRDMVSHGEIDFQTFSDAMYDAFADHAVEANNTFQGALSNTKAALSKIGAEIADDILPAGTRVLNAVRKLINSIKTAIMPILNSLGKLVRALGETIGRVFDRLRNNLDLATQSGKKVLTPIRKISDVIDKMTEKVTDFGVAIGVVSEDDAKKLKGATEEVGQTAQQTTESLDALVTAVMRGDYRNGADRVKALGDAYAIVQNKVNETLGSSKRYEVQENETTRALMGTTAAVKTQAEVLEEQTKELKKQAAVDTLQGFVNIGKTIGLVIKSIGQAIADCFKNVKAVDLDGAASKFKDLTGSIVNFETRIQYTKDVVFNIVHSIANVITAIGKVIGSFGKAVIETLQEITGYDLKSQTKSWRDFTKSLILTDDAAKGLKDIFKLLLSPLKVIIPVVSTLQKALLKLGQALATLNNKFLGFVGKSKVLEALNNVITKLISSITGFFKALSKTEGFKKFTKASQELWKVVGDKLVKAFNSLADKLAKVNDKPTKDAISGTEKLAKTFGKAFEAVSKFVDGIKKLLSGDLNIGDIFSKASDAIKKFFENINFGDLLSHIDFLGLFKGLSSEIKKQTKNVDLSSAFSPLGDVIQKSYTAEIEESSAKASKDVAEKTKVKVNKPTGFIGTIKMLVDTIVMKVKKVDWKGIGAAISNGLGAVVHSTAEALNNDDVNSITKSAFSLVMAFAMLKNAFAMAKMWKGIDTMTKSIGGFFDALAEKISVKSKQDSKLKSLAKSIAILGGVVAALAIVCKIAGKENLKEGLNDLTLIASLLMSALGALTLASKYADPKAMTSLGKTALSLTAGIGLLAFSVSRLAKMDTTTFAQGLWKVGVLIVAMVGAVIAINRFSKMSVDTKGFVRMAIAVNLMILPLKLMSMMPVDTYLNGLAKVGLLMGMFTAAIAIINATAKESAKSAVSAGMIAAMALDIVAMTGSLLLLSLVPWDQLAHATVALGATLVSLGISMKLAASGDGAANAKVAKAMALEVVALAISLTVLTTLPTDKLIASAASLSGALIALGFSMKIASSASQSLDWKSIGMIAATSLALAFSLSEVAQYSWPSIIAAGASMSGAILAVAFALRIASNEKIDIGSIIAFAGVSAVVAAELSILAEKDWKNMLAGAISMSGVILAVAGALALISKFGGTMSSALSAAVQMGVVLGVVGGVLDIVLNFMPKSKGTLKAVEALCLTIATLGTFVALLGNIPTVICAKAIANAALIGAAIDAIMLIVTGGLWAASQMFPTIGKNLEKLAGSLKNFTDTLSNGDASKASKNIKAIGAGIGLLVGGNVMNDISTIFGGGLDKKLPKLGDALKKFADHMPDIDSSSANGIKAIGEAVNAVAKVNSANVEDVTKSLNAFKKTLDNYTTVDYAALANASTTITTFVTSIQSAADQAAMSSQSLASNVSDPLAGMQTSIDSSISGSMSSLIEKMPELQGMSTEQLTSLFNSTNGTVQNGMSQIDLSANGGADTTIQNLLSKIGETSPQLQQALSGMNQEQLNQLVSDAQKYTDGGNIDINAFIAALASGDPSASIDAIQSKAYGKFSSSAAVYRAWGSSNGRTYASGLGDIGPVNAVGQAANTLSEAAYFRIYGKSKEQMAKAGTDAGTTYGNKIAETKGVASKAGSTLSDEATKAASVAGKAEGKMKSAGKETGSAFSKGLKSRKKDAESAGKSLANSAISGAKDDTKSRMTDVGEMASLGFANGIDKYGYLANRRARKMVSDAINAARNEAKVASPSKKTYAIGKFFVLGMSNAIRDNGHLVADNTIKTVSTALDSMSSIASQAAYEIEHGFDNSAPTISPVVDMSNIRQSAAAMGSLFSSANVNAGAVQYDLVHKYQNGSIGAGSSTTNNNNNVTNNITVNAAPGQSVKDIADAVSDRLAFEYRQKRSVFA